MLFLRLHLDDQAAAEGAMEIARGSHIQGRCRAALAATRAARYPPELTIAKAGDVLILPMLTLHRSSAATSPTRRRTLRIDLAFEALPAPLEWAFDQPNSSD